MTKAVVRTEKSEGTVLDATSPKVTVKITKKQIDEAIRGNSSHCMIADAVKEQVPGAKYVSVDLQSIRWTDTAKGRRYTYLTPPRAQRALVKFDQGDPVGAFQMTLQGAFITETETARRARLGDENAKAKLTTAGRRNGPRSKAVGVGGKTPPIAALHSGSGANQKTKKKSTAKQTKARKKSGKETGPIGATRQYGLRSLSR